MSDSALFHVVVCAALIDAEQRIFLARRSPKKKLGGKWEFPGGKLEIGESLLNALQREFMEELSIQIHDATLVHVEPYSYPHGNVLILFYVSKNFSGIPKLIDHDDVRWCRFEDIASLPLLPANQTALEKIKEFIAPQSL